MPPLDAERLWVFTVVARERGFSRAARALHRTQSSVSQAMARLEAEVAQPLFARAARGVELTAPGRLLLEHATRILDEMEHARRRLGALGELREGELTIGTSDTLACHLLPPVFAAFRRLHPSIELHLVNRSSPAVAELVATRTVDVGVVSLPLPAGLRVEGRTVEDRIAVQPLGTYADVAIGPPDHPALRSRRVSLARLAQEPLLLLERGSAGRAHLDAALAAQALVPRVAIETGSVDVLRRLAELGFGLAVVPAFAVTRERIAGTLATSALERSLGHRQVGLLSPRSGPLSRAAEAFATVARSGLRRIAG